MFMFFEIVIMIESLDVLVVFEGVFLSCWLGLVVDYWMIMIIGYVYVINY